MNAYAGDPRSARSRASAPARARRISVSLFDAMAEWMTVPLLQHEAGKPPQRIGLAHPSIAPYGVFKTATAPTSSSPSRTTASGACWPRKCCGDTSLGADPKFATNPPGRASQRDRRHRGGAHSAADVDALMRSPRDSRYRVRPCQRLRSSRSHPHLRRITVARPTGPVACPAPPRSSCRRDPPIRPGARRSASTPKRCGRSFPSPLWGRVGWGSGGRALTSTAVHHRTTPTPAPPHKGEGKK